MAIAINPTQTFDYVLRADRELPAEEQTVWKLRGLSHRERAQVEDNLATQGGDGQLSFRIGSQRLEILKAGLLGFENFLDAEGRPVPFDRQGAAVHDRTLDRIAEADATELANAITARNSLSEKESD